MTDSSAQRASAYLVYIGTYTEPHNVPGAHSQGIYVYQMDPASGALTYVSVAPCGKNPSFVTLHPNGRWLYAVHEVDEFDGRPGGGVSAFALDPATGVPEPLNRQLSQGGIPCHVTVDASGRHVLVANFVGGSVTMLPLNADGSLQPASDTVSHRGLDTGAPPEKRSHAHQVRLDPAGRWAFSPDLGLDRVIVYQPDAEAGQLRPQPAWSLKVQPGAGPRHMDFHPNGRFAYLINELNGTLMALAFDGATGSLRELQTVSTLPEGYQGVTSCADIHVHPSGKFVYGSNRGHDSIVIFAIDPDSGRLTLVGHEPTQGRTPRNFALDPTGAFLLAANQDTSTVVTFRIDPATGRLTPTGQVTDVPAPVCLQFHHLS
jgi:6-phosphogluconolactonase